MAESPESACFHMFSLMPSVNKLSNEIRISQRGHDKHDDDVVLSLTDMFCLWVINMGDGNDDL